MNISKKIKERREALGMSQTELAEQLGYKSKASISEIESGKKDIPRAKVDDFAKVLKVNPSYLMGWEENQIAIEPENPIMSEAMQRLVKCLEGLTDEDIEKVLEYTEFLKSRK